MTPQRGFTLIEMAIVLVIITILIGGLAMPLSAQIQARRIAETRQTLLEARDGLLGFAMTHPAVTPGKRYLPCPDTNGDGVEDRSGTACTGNLGGVSFGWLPWVTLGTASQDAWGNRLRYVVKSQFANADTGFSLSTPLGDPLQICTSHICPSPPDVADDVVAVVVSHGPNGWGAQNMNNPPGNLQAAPTGLDEAENLDTNRIFVMRAPTKADAANGEFDDLVAWVPLSVLIPRVCPTGSDCGL